MLYSEEDKAYQQPNLNRNHRGTLLGSCARGRRLEGLVMESVCLGLLVGYFQRHRALVLIMECCVCFCSGRPRRQ